MTLYSIFIPTYNRPKRLINCLQSIIIPSKVFAANFNVCISDNSNNSNKKIIKKFNKSYKIKYLKNKKNIGFAKNLIQSTNLSNAEFIWLLGDDDLILPDSLKILTSLLKNKKNSDVDFYYLNSGSLKKNLEKKKLDILKMKKKVINFQNTILTVNYHLKI
jgi:GT2 family glycosyltransferase